MLALAHPVRLAVLELLGRDGPLTATEAGALLGEAPGNMSWHLRVLARHGFVIEADGARGRRRPWRLAVSGTRWDPEPRSEEARAAADTLTMTLAQRAFGQIRAWLATRYAAPVPWQRAATVTDWTLYLTADEAEHLREAVFDLFEEFAARLEDPALRPAGAVGVHIFMGIHPQQLSAPVPPP